MDFITDLVVEYWPLLLALAAGLDTLAGVIPDKYVPYVGLIKRVFVTIKNRGEKVDNKGVADLLLIILALPLIAFYVWLDIDDDTDTICHSEDNASAWARRGDDVSCSGHSCTLTTPGGRSFELNCSCEKNGQCRRD
jgi:hypothetical protein